MEVQADPTTLTSLVVGDREFRSSMNFTFSEEDAEKALKELNETEDLRRNSLRKFKEMLSKDEVKYRTDNAYLLRFLRCKKFKCKEACDMIRTLYSKRKRHPDTFGSLPSHFESFLKDKSLTYLPYRDSKGSVVLLERLARWNPFKYSVYDGSQLVQIVMDVISMNPACQLHKMIIIIDLKDANVNHFSPFLNLHALKLSLNTVQNMNPVRIKQFILLNCHKVATTAVVTFKLFMKKKLADRILILGSDYSELHKHVNPAILPKEYGGSLEESQCTVTLDHILKNKPYLLYEYSFCNST